MSQNKKELNDVIAALFWCLFSQPLASRNPPKTWQLWRHEGPSYFVTTLKNRSSPTWPVDNTPLINHLGPTNLLSQLCKNRGVVFAQLVSCAKIMNNSWKNMKALFFLFCLQNFLPTFCFCVPYQATLSENWNLAFFHGTLMKAFLFYLLYFLNNVLPWIMSPLE